jgi:hypothetical protein
MTFRTKTVETMSFMVEVIVRDIEEGKCRLIGLCMEKVAIERALRKLDLKGGDHKVRIDGGDLRYTYRGYRYHGHVPKVAKRALIQFDKEHKARARAERLGLPFKSKVQPHKYRVETIRGSKVEKFTRERMDQINAARERRKAEGRPDKKRYDLRYRVEGLGAV